MTCRRISVAMCTCNGARYLREQLQSIAQQTQAPCELIVCDDASADSSVELVQKFALASTMPVRVFRNPSPRGCTKNFEQAIQLCHGDIIVLADQDDLWKPNKLAAICGSFACYPAAGYVFSDAHIMNQQGELLGFGLWDTVGFTPHHFSPSRQVGMLLRRNLVTGAAMAFRSSLRGALLPIPAAWNHDYWIALLGSVFSFGVPIQERLFLYRRHLDQQMGCGKLTFAQKIQASLTAEPDYRAKTRRITELRERVAAKYCEMNCPLAHLRLIHEKELHLAQRALIHSQRGRVKIATLVTEALTGRYQRFSLSWSSMIRDLLRNLPGFCPRGNSCSS